MKASSRTISLIILLCAFSGLFIGVAYRAHRTKARARGLLASLQKLDAKSDGNKQMEPIAQQFGLDKRCAQNSCVYFTLLQNPITLQRLRAPRVEMSFSVRVDGGRLAFLTITLVSTDLHRGTSAGVSMREFFQSNAEQRRVRVHRLAGENGRGVQTMIEFTPDAAAEIREAAFDLNSDCLARLRGCDAQELAKKAFALSSTE